MATSTLVQFLEPGSDGDISNRSQVETFLASGAIAKGDWVNFDTGKTGADRCLYVKVEDTSGGAIALGVPVIGVALEAAAAAGAQVRVVVAGYVKEANVATGTAAGVALALDTTTSGRAVAADAANVNLAGISLAVAASNTAPCLVLKKF
jgi:hypothetical protein